MSGAGFLYRNEFSGVTIFADFEAVEHFAAHGDPDAGRGDLSGGDCHAEIEGGIAFGKAGRGKCADEHDGFAGNIGQHLRGFGHGVGTVGNDDAAFFRCRYPFRDKSAVCIVDVEAVLLHQFFDAIGERNPCFLEQGADGAINDLIFAQSIKVIFVDGPASGEDKKGLLRHNLVALP